MMYVLTVLYVNDEQKTEHKTPQPPDSTQFINVYSAGHSGNVFTLRLWYQNLTKQVIIEYYRPILLVNINGKN